MGDNIARDQTERDLRENEPSPGDPCVERRVDESKRRGDQGSPQDRSQETSPECREAGRHHWQYRGVKEADKQRDNAVTNERDYESRHVKRFQLCWPSVS